MKKKNLIATACALYFTYFIHGIGVSILSQYKEALVGAWGAPGIATVLQVIAALGLGRLIALPLSGYASDRFGRKVSGLVGVAFYVLYFIGIAASKTARGAYALAVFGGIANSFLDTCVTPTVLEIFGERGAKANMFTKFSMSIGQFVLPFIIGMASAAALSYRAVFILMGVLIAIDGVLIAFLPFPEMQAAPKDADARFHIRREVLPVVFMGFTTTATFTLWLNCNQELGALYGMADPSKIQAFYALGTILAILLTAFVVLKKIDTEDVLILYPAICLIALAIVYFVRTPLSAVIGGFLIGYAGAGGVLQLVVAEANAYYPLHKGKITSVVMIASSIANYVVLALAGVITHAAGEAAPLAIVVLNMAFTGLSVLFALYVKRKKRVRA
ncbi:MAG: MFS transporter [Peptoniphilus sp.]|nr:MFS transporter [Peptoniphilus sp.]MDD7363496.1 MFS transporter [Bacillota bacterium]MDY6044800.1 MFS transporter [Peptoniphilus sp.]